MKCLHHSEDKSNERPLRHQRELTDFGLLGNLSLNISLSAIQHFERVVDYFWNSETALNKTIIVHVDGIAQITIELLETKTFKGGQLLSIKRNQPVIENNTIRSIIVML